MVSLLLIPAILSQKSATLDKASQASCIQIKLIVCLFTVASYTKCENFMLGQLNYAI